jgi:nicotinate-nucleotide adenylyltransferase
MILHLFGGSFDPPHYGHLAVAKYFSAISDLVLISPLYASNDKTPIAPSDLRVQMCELAFGGLGNVQVTSIDIERQSTTYTIDTVSDIQMAYPDAEIHVVVGSDALKSLPTWKDISELASRVIFDVVMRKGFTPPVQSGIHFTLHELATPDVSSSAIRDLIHRSSAENSDLEALTTLEVREFIRKNRLYHP